MAEPTKAQKQAAEAFNTAVNNLVLDLGGRFENGRLQIATKYGLLEVSPGTSPSSIARSRGEPRTSFFTVFCRFADNVPKPGPIGMNPVSGKWNWHMTAGGAASVSRDSAAMPQRFEDYLRAYVL